MLESIAVHLNKFNIEIPVPTLVQSLSDLTWNPNPRSQEFIISYLLKIFLFKWCYYVHRVENVAIIALLHITFAYRLKTTKICSLSLYQSNITTHITDKSMIF